jgi:hypothetical protein
MVESTDTSGRTGCYGLRLVGLDGAERFLTPAEDGWPTLIVLRPAGRPEPGDRYELDDHHADLRLSDGASRAVVDRAAGTVSLTLSRDYADEELLHPLLSGSMSVFNLWNGRDAFHAGAFALGGGAWGVIGDRGQGKSSLLGYLATRGIPVLADDVLVEDRGDVLPGPAFVDLRPDAAHALGTGRDMGVLGSRPRYRLDVPVPPLRTPLAGWLTLAWSDDDRVEVRPVPVPQRLPLLYRNRSVLLTPATPAGFVAYAAKPFYELRRPKRWDALPDVEQALRSALGG